MDTTKTITHISLCAGYGGIDLGLKRAIPNLRTIAFSEIEAYAAANLVAKMEAGHLDTAPVWSNLKTFPWDGFCGKVDILSGGFPCQPFSMAGKRTGDEDERHLFPYILEGIRRCRPAIVFLENVEGIISAKLAGEGWRDPAGTPVLLHVLRELERVGYKATAGIFDAATEGAPHQRKRVFIMAYNNSQRIEEFCRKITTGQKWDSVRNNGNNSWPSRPGEPQHGWEPPRVVGNAERILFSATGGHGTLASASGIPEEQGSQLAQAYPNAGSARSGESLADSKFVGWGGGSHGNEGWMRGEIQTARSCGGGSEAGTMGNSTEPRCEGGGRKNEQERQQLRSSLTTGGGEKRNLEQKQREIESEMGGNTPRSSGGMDYAKLCISCDNRTDELRLLGNGVVPATAEKAFRTLMEKLLNE